MFQLHRNSYDLAFIDGLHTNIQLVDDFEAVLPHLMSSCVVVLHDVLLSGMTKGVDVLKQRYAEEGFEYVRYSGNRYRNIVGTAFFARGSMLHALRHLRRLPYVTS